MKADVKLSDRGVVAVVVVLGLIVVGMAFGQGNVKFFATLLFISVLLGLGADMFQPDVNRLADKLVDWGTNLVSRLRHR